jgi:D-sedoheptulose 7-phosphate isomerase
MPGFRPVEAFVRGAHWEAPIAIPTLTGYLGQAIDLLKRTRTAHLEKQAEAAIECISAALARRLPLLVCGNGGSASDAMHIAGELVGRFLVERPGLKVIALGADTAALTAWSNDYSYETAYARQVEAYGEPGGVVWGLSTSGNSRNVIEAFRCAKALGMTTVALTGQGGGKLAAQSDILLDVPSRSTPRIQEAHIALYHFICERVEARCAAELMANATPSAGKAGAKARTGRRGLRRSN